ncbi:MAG: histidinol dehydrogenase [Gammaproteobacteria bacterium]|nr:histidinol dehydrogenase [Gammaproteobacteria bacterium]MDH3447551.1 histidinol dehydrogenase [Gammaproteobacteria bacterium]
MNIRRLDSGDSGFGAALEQLISWDSVSANEVVATVDDILRSVRSDGDRALLEYSRRFDGLEAASVAEFEMPLERLEQACHGIEPEAREALQQAAARIRAYAERQKLESWEYTEADGSLLGQQVTPLDRVGLYVPGGKAAYPSSVLMNAIPAVVAGVGELIMVVPTPQGVVNELVLAAAHIAGVSRVFTIGGAQAIAALAYGTETVPAVDKIVGPGNIYVATAKRMVFGIVGIDMVAGPSEILVICDGGTDPDWIAMDLFSQAEHDEDAQAILLSPDGEFLDRVQRSIERLIEEMPRRQIIDQSMRARGALIRVRDLDEAAEVANLVAPEHLELSVDNARELARSIRHAGAIFLGRHTAEALGDYCAGPNHVLPTSRSARFSSPLGVYDFQKRSSLIGCSPQGASQLGKVASTLARGEGLVAHARSAEYRIKRRRG